MPGIGEGYRSVDSDMQRKASGEGVAAAEQTLVEVILVGLKA